MPVISMIKNGDDITITIQLTFDGSTRDITGATCTATIRDGEHPQTTLVSDKSVTVTTPATSVVTLTLTAANTAAMRTRPDYQTAINHLCDIKVVESGGATSHSDTVKIPIRRALT